jgi:WD40 repeat protein
MSTATLDFAYHSSWESQHDDAILCICISPDNLYVASGGADNRLIIWKRSSGEALHRIQATSAVTCMTWAAEYGKALICGLHDGTILDIQVDEVCSIFLIGYVLNNIFTEGWSRDIRL